MVEPPVDFAPDALRDAIDVWHLPLTPIQVDESTLAEDELARAARFRVDDKRIQFLAARAQMRGILARYVGARPAELRFTYGEHGKPALAGHAEIDFNLSHSGSAGLLGVTSGTALGVDVETEKPGRRFAGIAARFFAAGENDALGGLPAAGRPAAFYRTWTCKEAYLKAWGTGLSFPSNRFTIRYTDAGPPELLETEMPDDTPGAWRLRVVRTFAGHAAAVCYRGAERWLRHFSPGSV